MRGFINENIKYKLTEQLKRKQYQLYSESRHMVRIKAKVIAEK